jgi:surfeit locus 1 family protein
MNRAVKLNLNWRLTLFALVSFAGFVYLGLWQLQRADEKITLMALHEARINQPPIDAATLVIRGDDVNGLPVSLSGSYLPVPPLLRDNVILLGKVGFDVLCLFEDSASGLVFLVNRGFVPMAASRQQAPQVPPTGTDAVNLTGHVYVTSAPDATYAKGELIDELRFVQSASPTLLAAILEDFTAQELGASLYPHLIRLEAGQPFALPRNWVLTTMSPDRHRGYSYQWFLMAIAVLVAYGYFTFRHNIGLTQPD